MPYKVLFVDDEPHVTAAMKRALHKEPYEILTADSAMEALEILAGEPVSVVVTDERMPGMSGTEFITKVYTLYPDTIRIMLTGHACLETAIRAINDGQIYRFLTKPCNEVDLSVTIRQALQQKALMEESRKLLLMARQQSSLLQDLEQHHPGIMDVKKDVSGRIVIEDEDYDFDTLIEQINEEVVKSDKFFSKGKDED